MSGTVVLHEDPRAWLTREIDVARFMAGLGVGVVAPASSVDPGPFRCGGLWVSLWEHAELTPRPLMGAEVGRSLRELHDGLREYPGALPPRAELLGEIDWLLRAVPSPDLEQERDRLADVVLAAQDDAQALHGDASRSNLLVTAAGPRWNDFEDVCRGSVAWDVAGVLEDAEPGRHAEILSAYGRAVDPELLARIGEVHTLYGGLWRRYVTAQRGAAAREWIGAPPPDGV